MPNISQIEVGRNTYDIMDSQARDNISQLLKVENFTKSYTINGNSYVTVNITTTLNGYKPIGIIGCSSGDDRIVICNYTLSNYTVDIGFRNITGTQISSIRSWVQVLFIKE